MPEHGSHSQQDFESPLPRLELGQVVATPGALMACSDAEVAPEQLLDRHQSGDWGDLEEEDLQANEHAVRHGGRVFSSYRVGEEEKVWVITEADRSSTTLLLPLEY